MATATLLARPSSERVVALVGTCADGCCARFNCRACGHYWLGDEAEHACGSPVSDLGQRIRAWMTAELEEGDGLATCTRRVLDQVKAAGLADALLQWAIRELWRKHDDHIGEHDHGDTVAVAMTSAAASQTLSISATHTGRLSAQMVARNARIKVATAADNGGAVKREHQTVAPGPRRVNVEQLARGVALLESLFQIDGAAWIRLGDLNKRQCKALQFEYLATADQYRRKAIAFGRLGAGLADGQTVRERWTGEQLANLVGDNLRGAAPARPTY